MHAEVIRRLHARIWKPGDLLPHEAELAAEFCCARSTVNRALQAIAEEGLVERRRRGGTRVLVHPERKATFNVPVIRTQIEHSGHTYGYRLLNRRLTRPPKAIREAMQVESEAKLLHIRALHTADEEAFVLEIRWINLLSVPAASDVDFSTQSPNEWLLEHVPISEGVLSLSAREADEDEADALSCREGGAVFVEERLTRDAKAQSITSVRLVYAAGYNMKIKF